MPRAVLVAISLMVAACPRSTPPPPATPVDPERVEPSPREEPPQPAVALQPFAWDRVRVLGNGAKLDGPGLAVEAKPGHRVALLMPDGKTHVTAIDFLASDECDEGEECEGVWIVLEDELPRMPWTFPSRPDAGPDDIGLVETTLAVTGDMALPDPVPHAIEARYFDALCEGEADRHHFVLLERTSSTTPHPLADMPALAPFRGQPQRVVSVRVAGRSIHFVSIAAVAMPKSRRMFDLQRKRRETFFIIEGDGAGARILHTESHPGGRSTNHDFSCQLPLRYPIPWSVVTVEDEVFVLTRTGFDVYDRWSLTDSDLRRVDGWKADVLELF